jgi:adenine-specific DNA-methyltransferase
MLTRYLGNKTELLPAILGAVERVARPGALVCDAFAGTLAVSLALKRRGFRVAANDINLLSAVYGRAHLLPSQIPAVPLAELVDDPEDVRARATADVAALRGKPGFAFLRDHADRYIDFVAALRALEDAPPGPRRDIYDHYCEAGARSHFTSSRGRQGRRRFFSQDNAHRIDAMLGQLRRWRRERELSDPLYSLLLCALLEGIERVANTQGTYHDFPREEWDPRALRPLRLALPPLDDLVAGGKHLLGAEEDSLEFIRRVPPHDVLYIDPPYNFRQYTAYYFLPNLFCRYAEIDDLDAYFAGVRFVRGQNPSDDFSSPFCSKDRFLEALATLVGRARARTVILSYFDGRNHWNEFKADGNGVGYRKLADFFSSSRFVSGSLEIVPMARQNYQSYGGHKARQVQEYLFIARKARGIAQTADTREVLC